MIATNRLVLRPFHAGDEEPLVSLLSDERVMKFSVSGPKPAHEIAEDLFDWTSFQRPGRPDRWAVTAKHDGAFYGFCGFSHHRIDDHPWWELGYRLQPERWGCGFATEAAAACRDWFFAHTKHDRFALMIDPANLASARVAEKIGARHEFDSTCYGMPVGIYVVRRPAP